MSSLTPSLGKLLLFWFHKGHQHLTHKKQIPGYFVCLRTTRWANSRRRKVKFRQKEEPMTEHWLNLLFFHRKNQLQKMTKMSPFSGWFVYALNPYKEMHCDKGERSESPTSPMMRPSYHFTTGFESRHFWLIIINSWVLGQSKCRSIMRSTFFHFWSDSLF